ncbi:MAG: glycosyltransferase family 32 protein [Calditrichaceae bacterium]
METWMYWENKKGSSKPEYLNLCLETIRKNRGATELILLDEKSVQDYITIPDIIQKTEKLAHKADYIRARLLYEYGGIWLDSDAILLKSISDAVDPFIEKYDFVGCGKEKGHPSIWFMASRKGSPLIGQWIEKMDKTIYDSVKKSFSPRHLKFQYTYPWSGIGYDILWPFSENYPYYHHPFKTFAPLEWNEWETFFSSDKYPSDYVDDSTIGVMLYNKMMHDRLKTMSYKEIIGGDFLLARIFRYALGEVGSRK